MTKIGCISRLSGRQLFSAMAKCVEGGIGLAVLLAATGIAVAQSVTPGAAAPAITTDQAVPEGYTLHESVEVGGRAMSMQGSQAMYDTLVNQQAGPRMMNMTFDLRPKAGTKHAPFDVVDGMAAGFGGDPNNFAKMNVSKGKTYDFTGTFRRDRQYFDYDLLGNPFIPNIAATRVPIGQSNTTTTFLQWPQQNQSPVLFNTVRRMLDTTLTINPLDSVTYVLAYSNNIFEGPTLSPSYSVGKYNNLLEEYQRNGTDVFTAALEWKPVQGTRLTYAEEITRYKMDSYFTLNPAGFIAQEPDGTPVSLGNWTSVSNPYSTSACNTDSMGSGYTSSSNYTVLSASPAAGGLPVLNPACSAISSYMRSQPSRLLSPTEILRLQSNTIKNVSMNGNIRYTRAKVLVNNFYENFQGLDTIAAGTSGGKAYAAYGIRSLTWQGNAYAQRRALAADYGIVWQTTKTFALEDQFDYSDVQQPAAAYIGVGTMLITPPDTGATKGQVTINAAPLTASTTAAPGAPSVGGSPNGATVNNFFGQKIFTNDLTARYDGLPRTTLSLTYRYRTHLIAEGLPSNVPLPAGEDTGGTVSINENGAILAAAFRATTKWEINGSFEFLSDDNAFTPLGARKTVQYRVHSIYKPKKWATVSASYSDRERHNNTNNAAADIAAGAATSYGPLNHVDYSRVGGVSAVLMPNEHYGLDLSYSYSDIYTATNICFTSGAASAAYPGATSNVSTSAPNVYANGVCAGVFGHGGSTLVDWYARDFMEAPTQFGSASIAISPVKLVHSNMGYHISSVNGTRFYNDARDVAGSLVSKYQSPFADMSVLVHPGWTIKAEYNYFGYGEGGPSGATSCSTSTSAAAVAIPCNSASITGPVGIELSSSGLTAPRTFHASALAMSLRWEF